MPFCHATLPASSQVKFRVCSLSAVPEYDQVWGLIHRPVRPQILNGKQNNYFQYNLPGYYSVSRQPTENLWLPLLLRSWQQSLHRMLAGGRRKGGGGVEEISSGSWYVSVNVRPDQSIKLSSWVARSSGITILDISYLIWDTQVCAHSGGDGRTDSPASLMPEQVYEWSYESDLVFYKLIISQILYSKRSR